MSTTKSALASLTRVQLEAILEQQASSLLHLNDLLVAAKFAADAGLVQLPTVRRILGTAIAEVQTMARAHERACQAVESRLQENATVAAMRKE